MKEHNVRLNRLFKAARMAPAPDDTEVMPGHLKTRVLAHWRSGAAEGETRRGLAWVFRCALICAGVLMLASVAWSFGELAYDPEDDVAIANYELRADVMP